jgi:hypothetical protein
VRNVIIRISTKTSAADVSRNVWIDLAQEFYKQVKLKMEIVVNADKKVVVVRDRVEIRVELEGLFLRRISVIVDTWEGKGREAGNGGGNKTDGRDVRINFLKPGVFDCLLRRSEK